MIDECLDKNPETRPTAAELVQRLKRVKLASELQESLAKNKARVVDHRLSINLANVN